MRLARARGARIFTCPRPPRGGPTWRALFFARKNMCAEGGTQHAPGACARGTCFHASTAAKGGPNLGAADSLHVKIRALMGVTNMRLARARGARGVHSPQGGPHWAPECHRRLQKVPGVAQEATGGSRRPQAVPGSAKRPEVSPGGPRRSPGGPSGLQKAPGGPRSGPGSHRRLQEAPGGPKEAPGGPRCPQEAPGGPQEAPGYPKRPMEAPGVPQDAPGSPRRPQEAPGGSRRYNEAPGGSRRPHEAPGDPRRQEEEAEEELEPCMFILAPFARVRRGVFDDGHRDEVA